MSILAYFEFEQTIFYHCIEFFKVASIEGFQIIEIEMFSYVRIQ